MAGLKNSVPLKTKAILTVAGSLSLLVALVLWVTISTFLADKEGYLSDYVTSQVNRAASLVDARIERTVLISKLVHVQGISVLEPYAKSIGLKKALLLHVSKEGQLQVQGSFLDEEKSVGHLLDQLGWDGIRLLTNSVLIGKSSNHDLVIGAFFRAPQGGGHALISVIRMDIQIPELPEGFKIFLLDPLGDAYFTKLPSDSTKKRADLAELQKRIPYESNYFGLKTWNIDHKKYLVGYHRLKFKELVLIGMVEEKAVFSAIRGIISRSLLITISIFLMTTGMIILAVRKLTVSLQAMTAVTDQLSQGVFSYRVKTAGLGNDEIGTLATSFNIMAEKIDSLMTEVASQVEAKYENEAMGFVEQNLIIQEGLSGKQIQIAGETFHSKGYGGDWWYYKKVNQYVILIVSKVEGRGFQSALMTAVSKATLVNYVETIESSPTQSPRLSQFVIQLNSAIFEVSQGKLKMTCFVALIDTQSGQMEAFSASHPAPLLHRLEFENVPSDPALRFEPLQLKRYPPLGTKREIKVDVDSIQLEPSDVLFWYTPGLMTVPNASGATWALKGLYPVLANAIDRSPGDASQMGEQIKNQIQGFFGPMVSSLSNDVTFVMVSVPKNAVFKEKDEVA